MSRISLEHLDIKTEGEADLRGSLSLDSNVQPGYESLTSTVRLWGDGAAEQLAEVHRAVQATSPNFYKLPGAVALN